MTFRLSTTGVTTLLCLLYAVGVSKADTFEWTSAVSGNYTTAGNWTNTTGLDAAPPDAGDTALFNSAGTYTVTLHTAPVASDFLQLITGTVTLKESGLGGGGVYNLTTGQADATITGGTLLLGTFDDPVALTVGDRLSVTSGGTMEINHGSSVTTTNMTLGTSGSGQTSTLVVDGVGSTLTKIGTSQFTMGQNGATSRLTVTNGAFADINGTLLVANSGVIGSNAHVLVESGAGLELDSLTVGASLSSASPFGTVTLSSAGSTITQTGASTLTLGTNGGNSGTFDILDGTFTSGTGQTTINNTGILNHTSGTYNANGNILIDGGLFESAGGTFDIAPNVNINVQNGGDLNLLYGPSSHFNIDQSNTLMLNGGGSTLVFTGRRFRVQGGSTMNVINGAEAMIGTNFDIANSLGDGTLFVADAGSSVTADPSNEQMWWGRSNLAATVTFTNGATGLFLGGVEVANFASVASTVTVNGGATVTFGDLDLAAFNGNGGAELTVSGAGSKVSIDGASYMYIGTLGGAGSAAVVSLESGGELATSTGETRINTSGVINLDGGVLSLNGPLILTGGAFNFNSGTLNLNVPTIDLFIGNAGHTAGPLALDDSVFGPLHTLNLAGNAYAGFGDVLPMTGGTLSASSLLLQAGASLTNSDSSSVVAPVLAMTGSQVDVNDGTLMLGDPSAPNGFYSNGNLDIAAGATLQLQDANDAVLDSAAFVSIGNGATATLSAPNGLTLDFGGNIAGFGTVDTPNDPFKPLINNGNITGNSVAEPITLTGYVKGVGTLDNVVITGTDAPGFSPATVYRGSVTYAGSLEIEIGGTSPGDFDRIVHSGTATLGGTLDVSLINGFVPSAGDSFDILDWGTVSGDFAALNLPALGGGLDWDTSGLLIDGTLSVVSLLLEGDLNADGFVGIADLNIVLGNWNQNVTPGDLLLGDPSGDGFVGIADLNVVLGNWNAGTPPSHNTNIPEPATLVCLGLGVCLMGRMHQR